jgi:DNA-binding response OmpR family regulator
MEKKPILLVDSDGDCEEAVASAAAQTGCRVEWVRSACDVFRSLCSRLHEFALIVIDIDPGSHVAALLEAINLCANVPPVITLTGFEESYMSPLVRVLGARACIGKPIACQELAAAFQKLLRKSDASCDRWGYRTPARIRNGHRKKLALRGIAQKLSPIVQTRV